VFTAAFWKSIKDFDPDIIHYVPGPTPRSFLIAKILGLYCRNARIVMSAAGPAFLSVSRRILPLLRPDILLTQSTDTEKILRNSGCKTEFLPSGVDTQRFTPVSQEARQKLREKHGLDPKQFICLHVGTIRRGRNIHALARLQDNQTQILVVGRVSRPVDNVLCQELRENGCLIWVKEIENIEEIYALSDCYLFPTVDRRNSIEMPLSVIEAMSCNLPIICTRFGALPQILAEGDGLNFVINEDDFFDKLQEVKLNSTGVGTREKIVPYTWEKITDRLEEIYSQVMEGPVKR